MQEVIVVVDAPGGEFPEGAILEGNAARVARLTAGVVALGIDPQLIAQSGISGWAKRSFGVGWLYDPIRSGRGSPLTLHVAPERDVVEWAARLERVTLRAGESGVEGQLQFALDGSQIATTLASVAPVDPGVTVATLGAPDERGGWTVRGSARLTLGPSPGLIGLQLYGCGLVRVRWFAAAQSRSSR